VKLKVKVNLCESGCCPVVETTESEVLIGEEGNLVRLKKSEWNSLVAKIKSGELGEL